MKKAIALFLSVLMLAGLCACGVSDGGASPAEPGSSALTAESSVAEEESSSGYEIPARNVSRGKSYITTLNDNGEFRRDDWGDSINGRRQRLTDGISLNGVVEGGVIAGYTSGSADVVLDLGETTGHLKTFSFDLYYGVWGIEAPTAVSYSVSADGVQYTDIGTVSLASAKPIEMDGGWNGADFRLSLTETVSARYIKISIAAGNHIWSSEIVVLTGSNGDFEQPEEPVVADTGIARIFITAKSRVNREEYVSCEIRVEDVTGVYSEITDTDGQIRVRGNSTSTGAKKPYNIKFSSQENLLGLGKNKKFCLLANCFDKTLMRDKLSYDFADMTGNCDYTVNSTFADVYLNGRYLGNYMITQAVDVGGDRVDIDITDNDFLFEYEPYEGYSNPSTYRTPYCNVLLGFNDREAPTDSELEWVSDFFEKAETALLSKDRAEVEKYFDVASFVDFYIANELFKNVDFATSSTRFYIKDGVLYAGPMWDLDLSSGNVSEESEYYVEYWNQNTSWDDTESYYCRKIWYGYLFDCDWFAALFAERYAALQPLIVNLTTDNELGKNRIDLLISIYGKSFIANYEEAGWSMTAVYGSFETRHPKATFEENVEFLRDWLIKRNNWILAHLDG